MPIGGRRAPSHAVLSLIPVVQAWPREPWFGWAPPLSSAQSIVLRGGTSDAEVALVVATLASCNGVAPPCGIAEAAQALEAAETPILPGGLLVRAGALEIPPSCCCGLETWREWYDVAPGGTSPWLGHSPSPWVECRKDYALIHADEEMGAPSPTVAVSYSELGEALAGAHAALRAFTRRLSQWLDARAPGTALERRFAEVFDIR